MGRICRVRTPRLDRTISDVPPQFSKPRRWFEGRVNREHLLRGENGVLWSVLLGVGPAGQQRNIADMRGVLRFKSGLGVRVGNG